MPSTAIPNPATPKQGELFADPRPPLPPSGWAPTSRAAAQAIRESAPTLRLRVLEFITRRGVHGATNEEVSEGLRMRLSSTCGRCNELWGLGEIRDSGETRPGSSGREARVWVVA